MLDYSNASLRDGYIDETWCALCGYRTDGGPCPQGCPSEFDNPTRRRTMTITSTGQRAYAKVEEANMADHDVDQPLIRDLLDRVGSLVDLGVTVDRTVRDQLIMDLVDMVRRLERQASFPARPFGTGSTMRRRLRFYRDTITENHSDAYERANRPGAPL